MRTEYGDDTPLAKTLCENCKNAVLRDSGTDTSKDSHKAVTVAVTTAPRRDCTLAYCLASIEANGWNPIVFAEPGSTETDYQTIKHPQKLGIWHNWLTACKWAIANGNTEYIMTVQDDSLFHPDSKLLVAGMEWPDNCGFVSLYTPRHYSRGKPPGINHVGTRCLWGACALLFKVEVLERVLASPRVPEWFGYHTRSRDPTIMERRRADTSLVGNSDTVIGKIINDMQMKMYFVEPSPVHHIARHSTISHGSNVGNRNCDPCSNFDQPLLSQVYK